MDHFYDNDYDQEYYEKYCRKHSLDYYEGPLPADGSKNRDDHKNGGVKFSAAVETAAIIIHGTDGSKDKDGEKKSCCLLCFSSKKVRL